MAGLVNPKALETFRGRRVLITGDTGFKGSWLSLWLSELGAQVAGYALPPPGERDLFRLAGVGSVVKHQDGDLRDLEALDACFQKFEPEIVFHLAAQSLVRLSYEEPKLTFDTNVGGSVNLLEAVRKAPSVRVLIYITSDKCYWNQEWTWGYRETDTLGGADPYSASKAAAEMVFQGYVHSFFKDRSGFGASSVRAGNVIGGGDWARDRIVPDAMRALAERRPLEVRNPSSTRPWQHVLEPLSGYLLLASKLWENPTCTWGSFNFGPNLESVKTVEYLVHEILRCWGGGSVKHAAEANAPHEARLLQLNCDKALSLLGWKPKWRFEKTVAETTRWYRLVHEGRKAADITREQIRAYMEDGL